MNDAGTVILDTRWLVIGNYGIIYDLNLSGCNGRKIQFSKATNNAGTIMTRVNNGTWYAKSLPFTYDASTTSLLQIILQETILNQVSFLVLSIVLVYYL